MPTSGYYNDLGDWIASYASMEKYDVCYLMLKNLTNTACGNLCGMEINSVVELKRYILNTYPHYFCHSIDVDDNWKECDECLKILFYKEKSITIDPILEYDIEVMKNVFDELNSNILFPKLSDDLKNVILIYVNKYKLELKIN